MRPSNRERLTCPAGCGCLSPYGTGAFSFARISACGERRRARISAHRAMKTETHFVPAAAEALGVPLTEHATVLARAGAAVSKIDDRLEALRRNGGLKRNRKIAIPI